MASWRIAALTFVINIRSINPCIHVSINSVPVAGHVPVGAQRQGEAAQGDDEEGGLQRPAAQRPGAPLPDPEVHQQARPEEARREAGTQGQPG